MGRYCVDPNWMNVDDLVNKQKLVNLDCYECGAMCHECSAKTTRTCKSCRGEYCITQLVPIPVPARGLLLETFPLTNPIAMRVRITHGYASIPPPLPYCVASVVFVRFGARPGGTDFLHPSQAAALQTQYTIIHLPPRSDFINLYFPISFVGAFLIFFCQPWYLVV